MPPAAIALVLTAAVFHALWNVFLKQIPEKYIATAWASVAGAVCFTPFMFTGAPLPPEALPFAILSAIAEAVYFMTLAAAYSSGDFSLVYPIARGSAPAFLAVWSMLFLHDNPTPAGILGLVILVGGLMVVGSSGWWSKRKDNIPVQTRSVVLAAGVALCISIYSVIDGAAVKRFEASSYAAVVFWLTALLILPFAVWRFGWQTSKDVWQKSYLRITGIGLLSLLAYWLVLNAYAIAPVSYAGAMREMSVVFGALAGWLLLKEGFGAVRAFGSVIIFAGILIVAVAG